MPNFAHADKHRGHDLWLQGEPVSAILVCTTSLPARAAVLRRGTCWALEGVVRQSFMDMKLLGEAMAPSGVSMGLERLAPAAPSSSSARAWLFSADPGPEQRRTCTGESY